MYFHLVMLYFCGAGMYCIKKVCLHLKATECVSYCADSLSSRHVPHVHARTSCEKTLGNLRSDEFTHGEILIKVEMNKLGGRMTITKERREWFDDQLHNNYYGIKRSPEVTDCVTTANLWFHWKLNSLQTVLFGVIYCLPFSKLFF